MPGVRRNARKGRVVLETVTSKVLRGNPLRDPHVRTVPVYLPPGYDDSRDRYPVIYVLTGYTGSGRMLLNFTHYTEPLDARMDRLIGTGNMPPVIAVMPDCFTRLGGSQYLNSVATGRYEDHLVGEIVPFVDAKYRTLRRARHRGITGKSSGGYGAIVHAMRHPEVFGAVACHSGDMAFEYCYMADFPKFLRAIWKKGSIAAWWRSFERAPKKTWELLAVLDILAMAAAYSPNPKARPFRLDLPFDLGTGEIREDVWRRWLRLDPVRMIEKAVHRRALRRMSLVYLDCGTRDEFQLDLGARIFASKLREHGIRHVHEEFDDGHMDVSYRYDRSFPLLARAISRRR